MPRVGQMSPSQGGGGGKPPQGPSLVPVLCQETLLTWVDPSQLPWDPTLLTPGPTGVAPAFPALPACLTISASNLQLSVRELRGFDSLGLARTQTEKDVCHTIDTTFN